MRDRCCSVVLRVSEFLLKLQLPGYLSVQTFKYDSLQELQAQRKSCPTSGGASKPVKFHMCSSCFSYHWSGEIRNDFSSCLIISLIIVVVGSRNVEQMKGASKQKTSCMASNWTYVPPSFSLLLFFSLWSILCWDWEWCSVKYESLALM